MPSSARDWSIGSTRGPHIASTQWASALRPDATLVGTGSPSIRLASYTIARGSTRGSTPVVLRPSSVRPQTSVASEPAYVVGTATIGSPVVRATAFASPVVDPPPTHTRASTPVLGGDGPGPLGDLDGHVHGDVGVQHRDRDAGQHRLGARPASDAIAITRAAPEPAYLVGDRLAPPRRSRSGPAAATSHG